MNKLIRLHPADNVLVVRWAVTAGEEHEAILVRDSLDIGHKVAAVDLCRGEKIIKFGVPIGSATDNIPAGAHVHLHNMKSDYIPTFTYEHAYTKDEGLSAQRRAQGHP